MTITPFDEYYVHQISETIDKMKFDSPHAYERTFLGCHNADGTLNLHAGIGCYPNANVMDGFVCVRYKDFQRNIFLSRHLETDRTNLNIGPLTIEVLEPLKRVRVDLDDNDYGIGCSLEFTARGVPWQRPFIEYPDGWGEQAGYDQGGRYSGSITFEDKKFSANGYFGGRDRTWGVRAATASNELMKKRLEGECVEYFGFAHFSDFCLHVGFTFEFGEEWATGQKGVIWNDDGTVIPLSDVRHRFEFMPGIRQYAKAEMLMKDANGKEHHLVITPISPECYLKGSRYDGRHGHDRGIFHVEGEKWDVSQPYDIGHEIFAVYSPIHRIAEFQLDGGEIGVGFLENMFSLGKDWEYKPTW